MSPEVRYNMCIILLRRADDACNLTSSSPVKKFLPLFMRLKSALEAVHQVTVGWC